MKDISQLIDFNSWRFQEGKTLWQKSFTPLHSARSLDKKKNPLSPIPGDSDLVKSEVYPRIYMYILIVTGDINEETEQRNTNNNMIHFTKKRNMIYAKRLKE